VRRGVPTVREERNKSVPHEFRNARLSLSTAWKNAAEGIFDTIEFFIKRISTVFIVDTCRARLFLRINAFVASEISKFYGHNAARFQK